MFADEKRFLYYDSWLALWQGIFDFLVNSFHFKLCFNGPFDRRTAVEDASGFGPPWHFDYPLRKAAFLAPRAVSFPLVVSAFHLAFPLGIFLLLVLLFLLSVSGFCRSAGEFYWFYRNTFLSITWSFIFQSSFLRWMSPGSGGLRRLGWLALGFFGAGKGRSGRWRESHLPGKVLLLIIPWRLFLSGSDIITTWSNLYVLFRTK